VGEAVARALEVREASVLVWVLAALVRALVALEALVRGQEECSYNHHCRYTLS